jgi:two-component system sensor histidine kinase KdpD
MTDNRADSFLRLIRKSQRGRLKIYLGYAAGVGKTYQMLLEAHRLKKDGIDVAVGLIETHGRAETAALLEGLEVIPRRKAIYRGIEIDEMDMAAILIRRPNVVLVDELAHTNIPGSKNEKRYQDVDELLAAGIHVISTLNVQHLESLYETVERAVAVRVRERIPDRVVAEADQLVNVDITSEDLRRRLTEGRIYPQERIETALTHFFMPANLEQLRELTLREMASQIDSKRRDLLTEGLPSSPDQIMVALSSRGPNSEALLRYASRLAGRLNRNWYAVYVQTSQESPLAIDAATQRRLTNTLTLAQQLGAMVFTYRGDDVVKTILQFAKEYRVGHIVIGASGRKIPFWRRLKGESSIMERLVTEGKGITIVVLNTQQMLDEHLSDGHVRTDEKAQQGKGEKRHLDLGRDIVLPHNAILIWDEPLEKEAAMRQLLDACCSERPELKESTWEALLEREQQGGTFVGDHVAIPHARIEGLQQSIVALGVAKAGIQDAQTGHVVQLMVLLLSSTEPAERHVETLGVITRLVRDEQLLKKALAARVPMDILSVIPQREKHSKAPQM